MSSSKRHKLSLKKTRKNEKPSETTPTILSMFKKQNEKEKKTDQSDLLSISSGNEGDVVITKVENSEALESSASRYFSTCDSKKATGMKRKLSLRKSRSESVNIPQVDQHDNTVVEVESRRETKSPGRYQLRMRSTVSLKESDNSTDSDSTDEFVDKKLKKLKQDHTFVKTSSSSQEEKSTVISKVSSSNKVIQERKCASERKGKEKESHHVKKSFSEPVSMTCDLTSESTSESTSSSDSVMKVNELLPDKHEPDINLPDKHEPDTKQPDKHTPENRESEKTKMHGKLSLRKLSSSKKLKSSVKNTSLNRKGLKHTKTSTSTATSAIASVVSEEENVDETREVSLYVPDETKLSVKVESQEIIDSTSQQSSILQPFSLFAKIDKVKIQKECDTSPCVTESMDISCAAAHGDQGDIVEVKEDTTEEIEYRVPYYLENFRTILNTVFAEAENTRLFNDSDMHFVEVFNNLEEDEQKLYIRLFSRKLSWLSVSKLTYVFNKSLDELVDSLTEQNLLISGDSLTDLDTMLGVMAAPDLQALAKSFHLYVTGASKPALVDQLRKKSQQSSIGNMFKGGDTLSIQKTMVQRASTYLGKLCRLADEPRAVFIRVLMLFCLYNTNFDEDSGGGGGQNQLFQMLMANIGRVVYPVFKVNRQRPIFKDRDALIRFEKALLSELDLQTQIEKNKWPESYTVYQTVREQGRQLLKATAILKWDKNLPLFLRPYSAGFVYTRINSQGVEILQRLKKYREAVDLLHELLSQDVYGQHYRGHWYERLALNLDAHLKSPAKSLDVIRDGLNDKRVTVGRRLAVYQRAEKICGAPKSKFADRLSEFQHDEVIPAPEHYVEGMVLPDATSMKLKHQFIMSGDTESVTLCAVEELALDHYGNNGYPEGLHWEGALISHLFSLLCWDIVFMDVPDVFQSPFQTHPLDKDTPDFYTNRQEAVDNRLAWIQEADVETLCDEVSSVWDKHDGTLVTGINWERFTGPTKIQGLVRCMGGKVIAAILGRYVKNMRHTRSGFPDLTLWNTDQKTFKISEVKGPGDRLSHKQILWLDFLLKLGVDAEVCYVKAVGSKKLKKMESN